MPAVARLDTVIKYLVLAFAAVMGFSRGGIHTVVWLLIVAAAIRFCLRPFSIPLDKDLKRAVLFFFAIIAIAALFSGDMVASLKFWGLTVTRFMVFLVIVAFIKEKKLTEHAAVLMAGSLLGGSAIAFWQGMQGLSRVKSMLGTMDFAGIVGLLVPLMLVIGLGDNTGKKARFLFVVSVFAAIVALFFNNTRAAWVTVFVSFVLYTTITLATNKQNRVRSIVIVCTITLFVVLIFAFNPVHVERMRSIGDTTHRSNFERLMMWQYAIDVTKDHWLLGVGPANLPTLPLSPEEATRLRDYPTVGHVHNNLLQISAESGIFGGIAYLFLFFTILKTAVGKLRQPTTHKWALVAILCTIDFMLHGIFDYTFNIPTIMYSYWFLLGLAYVNLSDKDN